MNTIIPEIFGELGSKYNFASVYTDDDQQDWFGVAEDGILISYVYHEHMMTFTV